MNLDPFSEFLFLRKRQDKQFEYLESVRPLIDPRVSDTEIMSLFDMGLDVLTVCHDQLEPKLSSY